MKTIIFLSFLCLTAFSFAQGVITAAGGNGNGNYTNQLRPKGLFIDGSNNLYVCDYNNSRVLKFPAGSDSSTYGMIVAGGNGQGDAANQLDDPTSLYVDNAGNLFVCDRGNHRIQKFPAGSSSSTNGTTVAGGIVQGNAANQLFYPTGIFVDNGGNIYVADYSNNRIQKFPPGSTSGTNATTVAGGTRGAGPGELIAPVAVYVDGRGYIYVSDQGNSRIQRFPPNSTSGTAAVTVAGDSAGSAPDQLLGPGSIYKGPSGELYVCDEGNNRIQKFPAGSTSGTAAETVAGGSCTFMSRLSGFAVHNSNEIFLADFNSYRVFKYSAAISGNPLIYAETVAGGNGAGYRPNQLYMPSGICISPQGNIYVTDGGVKKFPVNSTSNSTYTNVARNCANLPNFNSACVFVSSDLVVDSMGRIFAGAEYTVIQYAGDSDLNPLALVDSRYFQYPDQLCSDKHGYIYFNSDYHTVSKIAVGSVYSASATLVAHDDSMEVMGICLDKDGYLYVSDNRGHRILKFPPNATRTTPGTIVAGGNGPGPGAIQLKFPGGIDVDDSGNIYVSDRGNSRIQKFPPNSTSSTAGTTIAGGNGAGCAPYQLNYPDGICLYHDHLYIADLGNARVQRVGTTGGFITGINELAEEPQTMTLYPNPNCGRFILTAPNAIGQTYVVYDMVGHIVAENWIQSENQPIDIHGLQAGSYILQIRDDSRHPIRFTLVE